MILKVSMQHNRVIVLSNAQPALNPDEIFPRGGRMRPSK
jgi:hypothetical protein